MTRLVSVAKVLLTLTITLMAVVLVAAAKAPAADSAAVKALFADPPCEYASAPLWTWNDMLTEEQIRGTLRDLAGQKVKQAFVHPRPGLMTPYLSDDWFRLWKVALDEAQRLDMNIWIYDENSYPSGFAGGLVPEAMPESRGKGLHFSETKQPGKPGDDVLAVYRLTDAGSENVTAQARAGQTLPEGRYLVASIRLAPSGGWFGGKYYVDLLKPGVTEKFIEITFEAYRRELGEHFGKRLPGIFTDEPHLSPAGGLHWSDRLPRDFKRRWGYDLMQHLPSLVRPVGDWRRVRHNYYQFLLEEFIDCWAKPCYEYCEKHNLEFTGHYWEHGWPGAGHGGDNMAMYAWHQRPSIDTLMNDYNEGVNAQFGNVRAVKELASVANQLGRKRTLCEAYGAGGWDLRFEDMKRIGDWLYVLGVNTLDEHVSYVTIRGARKRDHPQSFSYHEPWWEAYHVMAEYFTRLSLVMSSGRQMSDVLVLEPTSTTWMYQGEGRLGEIGNRFQQLVTTLEKSQVEFDLACEDILGRHGAVYEARTEGMDAGPLWLKVGQKDYYTIVIPPDVENLNSKTMDLLQEYGARGGRVLACGPPPQRVDGQLSDRGKNLAGWQRIVPDALPAKLLEMSGGEFAVRRSENDQGILFHHRRRLDDGQILFLVNTSIDAPTSGVIESASRGFERWDLQSGQIRPYPFTAGAKRGIKAAFELPPCGSLLLFLPDAERKPAVKRKVRVARCRPAGSTQIRRVGPNVLTLDYVDVTAGDQTQENIYCYAANRLVWQQHGLSGNPWDSAVQFRDELITKKFPPESGFEATYRFTIEGSVPKQLQIVIERPDLYTITCNGRPVAAKDGAWWLDKAFGRIDIAAAAKVGENAVTIKASPLTIYHELEPAYVLGDFALKAADSGFAIVPGGPLKLGPWNEQGHPLYAAGVAYSERFELPEPSGRYVVSLPDWYGSVAKVTVNGKPAGHIAYQPWQCDVTEQISPGANTIEVVVVGTLKNTLGPHHNGPVVGRAWPHAFRVAPETGPPPGEKYHTLSYGLFEPFVLRQIAEP